MATLRLCSIPDCGKPASSRGWCVDHYVRWKRHGDPLGGRVSRGGVQKYFREVVLAYDGDDCLIWPFSTNGGYGQMRHEGRPSLVSRLVCEEEHGPPPNPTDHAAHLCGKGHLGCVARSHLVWKTPTENEVDKHAHGTWYARRSNCKLTPDTVRAIRAMKGTEPNYRIAARFNVARRTVDKVMNNETWKTGSI